MGSRLERERSFHDERFTRPEPRSADGFYAVCRESFAHYERLLYERSRGRKVLELGCGPSSYATHLAALDASVTGVDISEVAVTQSRARAQDSPASERLDFRVMDAEELDLEGDSYDLVCGTGILHHLDLARACTSIGSHMSPGGTALFLEPLGHNPAINAYRRLTPDQRSRDEHPLRVDDFELIGRHFGQVRVGYFHIAALLALAGRGRRRFDSWLATFEALDEWTLRRVKGLRRYAWIAVLDLADPL